jgi:hypothetical protein
MAHRLSYLILRSPGLYLFICAQCSEPIISDNQLAELYSMFWNMANLMRDRL